MDKIRRFDVVSTGYVVLDVLDTADPPQHNAGGTAGNVAANLAWLGAKTAVAARVGRDRAGQALLADFSAAGVDTRYIRVDSDVQTPALIHHVTARGSHKFLFTCSKCGRRLPSYRPITIEQAHEVAAHPPRVFFFDRASSPALLAAERSRASGALVVFEPNGLGREMLTKRAIEIADIVKISSDRLPELEHVLQKPPSGQVQVRTLGSRGVQFRIGKKRWRSQPSFVAPRLVDAGGAGDWVTAGLIKVLLQIFAVDVETVEAGLRLGQGLAVASCAFTGARGMTQSATTPEILSMLTDLTGISIDVPSTKTQVRDPLTAEIGTCEACLDAVAISSTYALATP